MMCVTRFTCLYYTPCTELNFCRSITELHQAFHDSAEKEVAEQSGLIFKYAIIEDASSIHVCIMAKCFIYLIAFQ